MNAWVEGCRCSCGDLMPGEYFVVIVDRGDAPDSLAVSRPFS